MVALDSLQHAEVDKVAEDHTAVAGVHIGIERAGHVLNRLGSRHPSVENSPQESIRIERPGRRELLGYRLELVKVLFAEAFRIATRCHMVSLKAL